MVAWLPSIDLLALRELQVRAPSAGGCDSVPLRLLLSDSVTWQVRRSFKKFLGWSCDFHKLCDLALPANRRVTDSSAALQAA